VVGGYTAAVLALSLITGQRLTIPVDGGMVQAATEVSGSLSSAFFPLLVQTAILATCGVALGTMAGTAHSRLGALWRPVLLGPHDTGGRAQPAFDIAAGLLLACAVAGLAALIPALVVASRLLGSGVGPAILVLLPDATAFFGNLLHLGRADAFFSGGEVTASAELWPGHWRFRGAWVNTAGATAAAGLDWMRWLTPLVVTGVAAGAWLVASRRSDASRSVVLRRVAVFGAAYAMVGWALALLTAGSLSARVAGSILSLPISTPALRATAGPSLGWALLGGGMISAAGCALGYLAWRTFGAPSHLPATSAAQAFAAIGWGVRVTPTSMPAAMPRTAGVAPAGQWLRDHAVLVGAIGVLLVAGLGTPIAVQAHQQRVLQERRASYADAQQAANRGDWDAAAAGYRRAGPYHDAPQRAEEAAYQAAQIKARNEELERRYTAAVGLMSSQKWADAESAFQEVLALGRNYKDAASQMAVARANARQALFAEGEQALAAQNWGDAVSKLEALNRLEPSYPNLSDRLYTAYLGSAGVSLESDPGLALRRYDQALGIRRNDSGLRRERDQLDAYIKAAAAYDRAQWDQ
ncbi:MAG: hypothetical protein ACRDJN_13045, partial [Chloroflexota bacterium]